MSTTTTMNTADSGTITLTGGETGPYGSRAATRAWLTGPGLPYDGEPSGFGALYEGAGPRRVAELVADAGDLARELRDQLVIGALRTLDRDLESIVLDDATGEVSTAYVHRDTPGPTSLSPPAPSVETLLRFAAATEELTASRGRFASYGKRLGPEAVEKAVAEASERPAVSAVSGVSAVSAVSGADAGDDVAPYWRMAALIRPLARITGPGTGLALDLPPRLLDEEFGIGEIMRFEEMDFPSTLTHGPTRRFLQDIGLPEDGFLFQPDTEVSLPTLVEYYEQERPGVLDPGRLPAQADRLIRLGHLLEDTALVVDGATGTVLCFSEPDGALRPLDADISTLAFTVWLMHREKSLDAEHSLTDSYVRLAATMARTFATVDLSAVARSPIRPRSLRRLAPGRVRRGVPADDGGGSGDGAGARQRLVP